MATRDQRLIDCAGYRSGRSCAPHSGPHCAPLRSGVPGSRYRSSCPAPQQREVARLLSLLPLWAPAMGLRRRYPNMERREPQSQTVIARLLVLAKTLADKLREKSNKANQTFESMK